jgi:hypothetical protein
MSGAGFASIVLAFITWWRHRNKDVADIRKTNAEAIEKETSSMTGGYSKMMEAMQTIHEQEKQLFQQMIEEEKKQSEKKMEDLIGKNLFEIGLLKKEIENLKDKINKNL